MAYWHGLYDTDMYEAIHSNQCNFSNFNNNLSETCTNLLNKFNDLVQMINVYDVYGVCYTDGTTAPSTENKFSLYQSENMGLTKVGGEIKPFKKTYSAKDYTPFLYKSKH